MALYQLYSFDFDAFQQGCTGKLPLAEAVASQITSCRKTSKEYQKWLPAGEAKLTDALARLLASDIWYPADADYERRSDIDQIVAHAFDKPAAKITKARPLGEGADSDAVDVVRGFLLLSKKGISRNPKFEVEPASELQAVGNRPYRNPAWEPELLAEKVNPFLTDERPPTADYSLHDPGQTKQLAGELEAFDLERLPDSELQDNFEANFRQPIIKAAKKGLALYVWQDF